MTRRINSKLPHRTGGPGSTQSASHPTGRRRIWTGSRLRVLVGAIQLLTTSLPFPAFAQLAPNARPAGGAAVAGQASISQTSSTTTVNQTSSRGVVNWQSFDVGSAQSVQFQQPSASAVTLNRVVGPNPSEIAGSIHANGQVVITNQAGLTFDKGAQINTAGIVVSAAGISNSNFMAGKMIFDQAANPGATVANNGSITVSNEGLAALVAPQVRNTGAIKAKLGSVILGGAEAETLDLYGDGLVSINVTRQVHSAPDGTKALVTNTGDVSAQGGTVLLTAQAVDGVVQTLVNAGGRIAADSTASRTGKVLIAGRGGDVVVDGAISAQGRLAGTTGGAIGIDTTGAVTVASGATINASGKAGGGTVAVGTTLARAKGGSSVTPKLTASNTTVAAGAVIDASATSKGNGGTVTLLSNNTTTFNGSILAKGGPNGGNGGTVETSGEGLAIGPTARVDALAPDGTVGNWLLDPLSITVQTSGGGTLPQAGDTTDTTTALVVDPATINLALANVELQASTFVTFLNAVNMTGTGVSLNVHAGGAVTVSAPITINDGAFTVQGFNGAPSAGSFSSTAAISTGTGAITINTVGAIALGGNLQTSGAAVTLTSGSTITQTGGVITANTLTGTSTGGASLTQNNQVATLAGFTNTGAGGFSFTDTLPAGLTVSTAVNAGTGNLTLTPTGPLTLTAGLTAATGTVTLDASSTINQTGGVITASSLTGTSTGGASLTQGNQVATLAGFTNTGAGGFSSPTRCPPA